MLADIAGIPVEEWLLPFILSTGGARWHTRDVFVAELERPANMIVELIDSATRKER